MKGYLLNFSTKSPADCIVAMECTVYEGEKRVERASVVRQDRDLKSPYMSTKSPLYVCVMFLTSNPKPNSIHLCAFLDQLA